MNFQPDSVHSTASFCKGSSAWHPLTALGDDQFNEHTDQTYIQVSTQLEKRKKRNQQCQGVIDTYANLTASNIHLVRLSARVQLLLLCFQNFFSFFA